MPRRAKGRGNGNAPLCVGARGFTPRSALMYAQYPWVHGRIIRKHATNRAGDHMGVFAPFLNGEWPGDWGGTGFAYS
jgi:hypothetical protein